MEASEDTDELTGAKAVRALFIDPLEDDGLVRRKGVTQEDHRAFLQKMVQKLKYCTPDTLERLRSLTFMSAEGPKSNVWPSLATIVNTAHAMQVPPDESDDIVQSWFRSGAGEGARHMGIVLATYFWIKRNRRPPVPRTRENLEFARRKINNELRDAQREVDLDIETIRRLKSSGDASPEEEARLVRMDDLKARLDGIIDAGIAHRAAKAEASEC